jgi:hypothetical protein
MEGMTAKESLIGAITGSGHALRRWFGKMPADLMNLKALYESNQATPIGQFRPVSRAST